MKDKDKKIINIAEQFGTPLYIYDANIIKQSYRALKAALPQSTDIFYSIKANPNIAISAELRALGAGAELCSYYEIAAAIKAGFKPNNIIFVGPAKSEREIEKCLSLGIYALICESKTELKLISKIAANKNLQASVALRINPSHISKTALLKMGGTPSQFGIDEEKVFCDKNFFLSLPNINIIGIHVYNGTRILQPETIIDNTKYIFSLAEKIKTEWQIDLKMVDVGGGIGIPYFADETEFNIDAFATQIRPIINDYKKNNPNTRLILESGRYLVGKSGIMLSRIIDIKESKGEIFIITDGGINCHMAAVGIGFLIKRNFPISLIQKNPKTAATSVKCNCNITGPLCTPNDLIAKHIILPEAKIGDLIAIHNSGAYGPTASPIMFLSHGFPAEALYKNGKTYLIRERFNDENFFANQKRLGI